MAQGAQAIPFVGAALPYREKFNTQSAAAPTTATTDVSPPGNAIKSYGYLRAIRILVTGASGTGGNLAADGPWNAISQAMVTQPNGEELYGSNTWTGYHAWQAAKHSGWAHANDPSTWPSFANSATAPVFDMVIPFEINREYGLGSLPNQDFSAPWKLQVTRNTIANIWQTAPTTTPTLQWDYFIDAWTVPAPQNPLTGAPQAQAPVMLGTLSKWTLQSYSIPQAAAFEVPFSRRGNAYRNLVFILRSSGARIASTNYPDPITVRWDGTVVRSNDSPTLWNDDDFMVRGGQAGSTPVTYDVGVKVLKMAAVAGLDNQAVAASLGMEQFWGTVQSSTVSISGTWGNTASMILEQLTNDVQVVDLTGNPYQFSGGVFLQAPAQVSARP